MNIAIDWAENPTARRVQVDPTTGPPADEVVPAPRRTHRRCRLQGRDPNGNGGNPRKNMVISMGKTWKIPIFNGKSQWKNMEKQEIPIFNGKHMENPL